MVHAPNATTRDLTQADAGTLHLTLARALLKLLANFNDLSHSRGTRWMPLGKQTAAWIDGDTTA